MQDIYTQHEKHFDQVQAFVICMDGARVATVALKFPKDGASRLYAYVHWSGVPMVRGMANGYGYDKRTAAVADAAKRVAPRVDPASLTTVDLKPKLRLAFIDALSKDDGRDWSRSLEDAGFAVLQAV